MTTRERKLWQVHEYQDSSGLVPEFEFSLIHSEEDAYSSQVAGPDKIIIFNQLSNIPLTKKNIKTMKKVTKQVCSFLNENSIHFEKVN